MAKKEWWFRVEVKRLLWDDIYEVKHYDVCCSDPKIAKRYLEEKLDPEGLEALSLEVTKVQDDER